MKQNKRSARFGSKLSPDSILNMSYYYKFTNKIFYRQVKARHHMKFVNCIFAGPSLK